MGTRGRGRPGYTTDARFVSFLVYEIESWLAAQGRAGKPLSVAAACRNVLFAVSNYPDPHEQVSSQDATGEWRLRKKWARLPALTFNMEHAKPLSTDNPRTLRNRYLECLLWLAENRDSPVAAEIARWREGRRLVADANDLRKPPRFSVQHP